MPASLPLEALRILDFSRVLAGPYATALMADMGADIIKIEPPGGDDYRHIGPFLEGESALFQMINRGKRSLVLDLKREEDRALARRLARRADVVVENFRPGVAARLGIDYETLKAENPRLVYASISGFGQEGPFADRPAYDAIIQGMSGLMELTGEGDGPPQRVGESIADLAAGLFATIAILAALRDRDRRGVGHRLDIAMFDCLVSLLPTALAQLLYGGTEPRRTGNRHPISAPFGAFHAKDGLVVIAVANNALFEIFAGAIGRPELAEDPRFATDSARAANEAVLRALIEEWSRTHRVEEIVLRLGAKGIPAGPIWSLGQALASDQARHRDLVKRAPHPRLGEAPFIPQPVIFDGAPHPTPKAAPALDADGASIRAEIAAAKP